MKPIYHHVKATQKSCSLEDGTFSISLAWKQTSKATGEWVFYSHMRSEDGSEELEVEKQLGVFKELDVEKAMVRFDALVEDLFPDAEWQSTGLSDG